MAGKIKGITIEYDASTVKLQTALNKIKAESGSVESELRKVNQNLKFDPKNTDLLATKQQLLKNRIEQSKKQLSEFRKVQLQLDAKKVDKTKTEYLKVKRAILEAEGKVRTFNAQLAKLQWQGVSKAGAAIKDTGQKLTRATRYARLFVGALAGIALYKGFERLKSLDETSKQLEVLGYKGKELEKVMDDVTGSVNGTRFMLQDMAKVTSGALGSGVTESYKLGDYLKRVADLAQLAGIDVQTMGAMMNKAYSRGKVDAKILNQLNQRGIPIYKLMQKQLGVNAQELQKLSKEGKLTFDDLYKATSRYEGLAQKMGTETLPGALTVLQQQFGLIGADFLSGVYEPLKTGTQDMVAAIKRMRQDGTFKEWGEDFGNTVKYLVEIFKTGEASMDGMSDRAKNMATALEPIIKTISGVTKAFAGLPPEIQGAVALFTLFGGPLLSGVGSAITGFASLATNVQTFVMNAQAGVLPTSKLASSIGSMSGAASILLNPLTIGIGLLAAWGLGVKKMYDETHQYTQEVNGWITSNNQTFDSIQQSNGALDIYAQKLEALMSKEEKTAADKAKIKTYVDLLNGSIKDLNLKYDEENDKLNKTTEAIHKKIDAYKQEALAKAYQDKINEGAQKSIQLDEERKKIQAQINAENKKYEQSTRKSHEVTMAHQGTINDLNNKLKDNAKAQADVTAKMDEYGQAIANMSPEVQKQWEKLIKQAEKAGVKIPESLKNEIASGTANVPSSLEGLYRKLNTKYSKMVTKAKASGTKIPKSIKDGINSGKMTPAQAAEKVERLVTKKLAKTASEGKKEGQKGATEYSSSISKGASKAGASAKKMADTAKSKLKVDTTSAGRDFGNGFKNGILGTIGNIASAAAKMVGDAIKAAKKKQKSGSPSRVMRTVGREYGQGYMLGLKDENMPVQRAASNLVSAAVGAATVPSRTIGSSGTALQAGNRSHTNAVTNTFNIYNADDAETVANAIADKLEFELRMEG